MNIIKNYFILVVDAACNLYISLDLCKNNSSGNDESMLLVLGLYVGTEKERVAVSCISVSASLTLKNKVILYIDPDEEHITRFGINEAKIVLIDDSVAIEYKTPSGNGSFVIAEMLHGYF